MKSLFSQKGVAAVEMALILPLLLILLFGIIEFSIVLYDKAMITNASREGARTGILYRADPQTGAYDPRDLAEIQAVVDNYLLNYLINFRPGLHTVEVSAVATSGQLRTVTVRYPYNFLVFPNLPPLLGGSAGPLKIDLAATTVMRTE